MKMIAPKNITAKNISVLFLTETAKDTDISSDKPDRRNKTRLLPMLEKRKKPAKNVPNILPKVDRAYKTPIVSPDFLGSVSFSRIR